jgi:AraC-like DNA-binding protein
MSTRRPAAGVELLRARLVGDAYRKHRHDTYAVGVTDWGVQMFDYRGAARLSTPGHVVVLHPDETHDGRAGTDEGFGYRIVYLDPVLVGDAMRGLGLRPYPLPFVGDPVSTSTTLARAIEAAFETELEPLAVDSLVVDLVEGLIAGARDVVPPAASPRVDTAAVERARQLLHAESSRIVHSRELENVTGLSRYTLCRQFRIMFGTTPHRYLTLRRLEVARDAMHGGLSLAAAAADAGFADQPHFTRSFAAAIGLTPARYRALDLDVARATAPARGRRGRRVG